MIELNPPILSPRCTDSSPSCWCSRPIWIHGIIVSRTALTFGGAVAGLAPQSYFGGFGALGSGFLGLAIGFVLFLPLYPRRDGRRRCEADGAVGAFLGPSATLLAAAFTMIVGGVMAVAILASPGARPLARRYFTTLNYLVVTGKLNHDGPREGEAAARRFPYALAIGLGTLGDPVAAEMIGRVRFRFAPSRLRGSYRGFSGCVFVPGINP